MANSKAFDKRFGSHISIAGGANLALKTARELGMQSLQVFAKSASQWTVKPLDPKVIAKFRAEWATGPFFRIVAHAAYLINLATPKDDLWEKSVSGLADELYRCGQLGIDGYVIHPGAHTGSGEEAGLARISAAIDRVDIPDGVMILLETTSGTGSNLGYSFEQLAAIRNGTKKSSSVGVCLDTCHVFSAGYDISNPKGYAETMASFDRIIGLKNLKAIHVNDSKHPLGARKDRHEQLGKGKMGLEAFRCLVNDPALAEVPMVLETEKSDDYHEDLENIAVLESLLKPEK